MKSLLDLLPKGGNSIVDSLQNELKFFRRFLFLIQEGEEALLHFLKGNLSHFDPHVGEASCQIRAYYFALLWNRRDEFSSGLERDLVQLRTYAERILILIDQGSRNMHRDLRPCSLSVFFENIGLALDVSETGLTLMNAHFLSKYRLIDEGGISHSMDALKLQRGMNESRIFVQEFITFLQRELSFLSFSLAMSWAEELSKNDEIVTTTKVLKELVREGDDGRFCLPSFGILDVILKHIRYVSRLPIFFALTVLTESSEYLSWKWVQVVDNQYKFSDFLSDILEDSSCLIIRAMSSNIQEISNENYFNFVVDEIQKIGIEKTFLWVNAVHPQYPGRKLRDCSEDFVSEACLEANLLRYKFCYEKAKAEARAGGIFREGTSFIYIYHFIANQISLVEGNPMLGALAIYRFLRKELIV